MRMRDKFHCYMPNTTTWQEAKPLTLEGAPRRARGKITSSSSRARSRAKFPWHDRFT